MSVEYLCELCKKVFTQKIDFTRHTKKKTPCISLSQIQELTQQKDLKMDIKQELIKIFKNCLNILRDNEGLIGDKGLRTMAYLFILKLIEPHLGNVIDIDNLKYYDFNHIEDELIEGHKKKLLEIVRFSNLKDEKEDNISSNMKYLWDDILSKHPITKKIFLKDKGFDIQHQSSYKKIIDKLDTIDLKKTDYDILGNAYEEVIKDIMVGQVLGQFFTQPLVKKMMVKLIDPQIDADGKIESCCDPTMGTGGFLITYLKYILKQAEDKKIKPDWDFIKNEGLYGKELEPDTYQLAISNLLISSGHMFDKLERGDSIRDPIIRKFDNILANPPYGIKGLNYDDFKYSIKNEYLPIKSDNAVTLFIQAIIYMLKINGKCAIVLPDGQDLFNKSNKSLIAIREYLFKTCDLKEIIYLPSGIFTYTSIKTCVFYFIKKKECLDILETKIKISKTNSKEISREYKFSKTHQTTKVKFYDSIVINMNKEDEYLEKKLLIEVPIEKFANNLYSLNFKEYLEEEKQEEQYSEDIIVKTLGEVCKFNIGGTPSRSINEYYENGTNLWASVRELNGGYIYDTKEKITDLGVQKSSVKLFEKDTILFSFKLSIGKTAIVGNPLYTNEAIAGISSKNNTILNNKYLYYYLTINDFSKLGSGILGNGSLNKKSLDKIKIPIPTIEKQNEIVEYLDFIYEKANKTSHQKITQLKKLNEYCLNNQKIFGDNVIKTLGEVCEINYGTRIVKSNNTEGEYPVYGSGRAMFSTNTFNREGFNILIARFALSVECIRFINEKIFLNDSGLSIKPKNDILLEKYIGYYLLYNQNIIYQCARGTAQKNLDIDKFKSIKISIPSIEKQKEIIEYCDLNDTLINQLEKEIEQNKKQATLYLSSIMKTAKIELFEETTEEIDETS
jgi:type I restriction-modification system DNA methylase subunit/restriction endonuclease S subunit